MPEPRKPVRPRRLATFSKWRLALMLFALLAVIALTVDLVTLRLRAERAMKTDGLSTRVAETLIEVSTATQRWVAAGSAFGIRLPPGWTVAASNGATYDVTLHGPYRLELSVAVRPAGPGGMEALRDRLLQIEEDLHLTTHLEADSFQGQSAWRRTMRLQKSTVETLDWLVGDQAVHVLMAAPPETFDDFRPVLVELRDSLQVPSASVPPAGGRP